MRIEIEKPILALKYTSATQQKLHQGLIARLKKT